MLKVRIIAIMTITLAKRKANTAKSCLKPYLSNIANLKRFALHSRHKVLPLNPKNYLVSVLLVLCARETL